MSPYHASVVFVLAAAPFARAAAPSAAANSGRASAIERDLNALTAKLNDQREQLVWATVAIGGIAKTLDQSAPESREAAETKALIVRVLAEKRRETTALELKTALLADQLQRYKETGVLSPTPAETVAKLKGLIDSPWEVWEGRKPVASLSLDLEVLRKQLRRYQERVAAGTEIAPAQEKRISPPPSLLSDFGGAGFERDRGTGKPETDPIPDLIAQLSASQPGRRALAADQLGSRGAAAAKSVPALKAALSDPDRRVRASAVLALGAIGAVPADVVAEMRRALSDKDEEVRFSAQLALRRFDASNEALRRAK